MRLAQDTRKPQLASCREGEINQRASAIRAMEVLVFIMCSGQDKDVSEEDCPDAWHALESPGTETGTRWLRPSYGQAAGTVFPPTHLLLLLQHSHHVAVI